MTKINESLSALSYLDHFCLSVIKTDDNEYTVKKAREQISFLRAALKSPPECIEGLEEAIAKLKILDQKANYSAQDDRWYHERGLQWKRQAEHEIQKIIKEMFREGYLSALLKAAESYAVPPHCPDGDINKCPQCGGEADNGHDRCDPPNPYYCSKCEAITAAEGNK